MTSLTFIFDEGKKAKQLMMISIKLIGNHNYFYNY